MPNRPANFASAIVVTLLAAAPLAALAQGAPPAAAADDCLAAPKNSAPAGSHWRYHIDRATKRHCWYLRDEHEAHAQSANAAAPANPPRTAKPASRSEPTAMQGSIANARAELPSQREAAGTGAGPWPAPTQPGTGDSQGANTPDATAQRSQIASRWPGESDTGSSAGSEPAAAADGTGAPQPSVAAPAPPEDTVSLAAADAPAAKQSSSIQTLLIGMTGALALAGLVGSAVVRFGRRRTGRSELQRDRRAIWDSAMTDIEAQPGFPKSGTPMPRIGIPDELRTADDPDERIAHMLSRLARSAQA